MSYVIKDSIQGNSFIKSGGTSSQFLKADGSIDTNSYITGITNSITGTGTLNRLPKFSSSSTLTNSNLTDTGTLISSSTDMSVNGVNLGRGGANDATNTVLGSGSFAVNSSGQYSVAIGNSVLAANTSGIANISIGSFTLNANLTGQSNVAIGYGVLNSSNSDENTGVGNSVFFGTTTGKENTAIGSQALSNITTGNGNIGIGYTAGFHLLNFAGNQTSDHSIYIGYHTKSFAAGQTNEIVIGNEAEGLGSNTTVIGNTSTTNAKIFGALTANTISKVGGTSNQFLMADGSISTLSNNSTITGTGTANYVPRFSSTSAITTSDIYNAGSNVVGVGTTNPRNIGGYSNLTLENSIGGSLHFRGSGSTELGGVLADAGSITLRTLSPSLTILFSINGNEKMRLDTNGNLGIGTSSPTTKLSFGGFVSTTNGSVDTLALYESGNVKYGLSVNTNGFLDISANQAAGNGIRFFAGSDNTSPIQRMIVNNAGFVGIGAISPVKTLEVSGTARTSGIFQVGRDNVVGDTYLSFTPKTNSTAFEIQSSLAGTGAASLAFQTGGGNVGIGAIAPSFKLTVSGTMATTTASGTSPTLILNQNAWRQWSMSVGAAPADPALIFKDESAALERMRINSIGNVGIGITSPDYPLHTYSEDTFARIAKFQNGYTNNSLAIYGGLSNGGLAIDSRNLANSAALPLAFLGNGTEWGRFTNTGKFGIGTTSPVSLLHVSGAAGTQLTIGASDTVARMHLAIGGVDKGRVQYDETNGAMIGTNVTKPLTFLVDNTTVARFGQSTYNFTINTLVDNGVDKLQVNGSTIATAIKKQGGTASQFLMADGTVTEFKEYTAVFNTVGTSVSTVVLYNTIGSIVWSNIGTGRWQGVLSGAFPLDKCAFYANNGNGGLGVVNVFRLDDNTIRVQTYDLTGTPANDIINKGTVTVKVFP